MRAACGPNLDLRSRNWFLFLSVRGFQELEEITVSGDYQSRFAADGLPIHLHGLDEFVEFRCFRALAVGAGGPQEFQSGRAVLLSGVAGYQGEDGKSIGEKR